MALPGMVRSAPCAWVGTRPDLGRVANQGPPGAVVHLSPVKAYVAYQTCFPRCHQLPRYAHGPGRC